MIRTWFPSLGLDFYRGSRIYPPSYFKCVCLMSVFAHRLCKIGAHSSQSQTTEWRQVKGACVVQLLHWGWVSKMFLYWCQYDTWDSVLIQKQDVFLWTWKLILDVGDSSLTKVEPHLMVYLSKWSPESWWGWCSWKPRKKLVSRRWVVIFLLGYFFNI